MDGVAKGLREWFGEGRKLTFRDFEREPSSLFQEMEDRVKRDETSDVKENRTKVIGTGTRHTKRKRRESMALRLASLWRMVGQKGRRVSRAEGEGAGLEGLLVLDTHPLFPNWGDNQVSAGSGHRSTERLLNGSQGRVEGNRVRTP